MEGPIAVSAGILCRNGNILLCSRPKHSALADFWEFPGGKQEPGETPEECLIRELREELGLEVRVLEEFCSLNHRYPDKFVCVRFFFAETVPSDAEPCPVENQLLKWVLPQNLLLEKLLPADIPVAQKLADLQVCSDCLQ